MMRKSTKIGAIAVAMLPILFAAGCTGTDVLKPTTGNLRVTLELVNVDPDGPFTDDPVGDPQNFVLGDIGFIQMAQITLRPVNPEADAALGTLPIGVLRRPLELLYNSAGINAEGLSLTSNTYRLSAVRLFEIFFANRSDGMGGTDVRPEHIDPDNPTCTDFVRSFDSSTNIDLTDFGGDVLISTDTDAPAELTIMIDAQAFVEAYTEAFNCNPCSCPAAYDPNDPSTFSCQAKRL